MPFSVKDWQLKLPLERDTRLQRTRDRLAAETTEERDARLECDRARHREQQNVQSQFPLLQQYSIQTKMRKLHTNMGTLDTPVCTTCSEGFPGLQLYSKSTECLRCSRNKHTPKVYSSASNINPGPIPPQRLDVSLKMLMYSFLSPKA